MGLKFVLAALQVNEVCQANTFSSRNGGKAVHLRQQQKVSGMQSCFIVVLATVRDCPRLSATIRECAHSLDLLQQQLVTGSFSNFLEHVLKNQKKCELSTLYLLEHAVDSTQIEAWGKLKGMASIEHPQNLFSAVFNAESPPKETQIYGITGTNQGKGPWHADPCCTTGINLQGEGSKLWLIIAKDSEEMFLQNIACWDEVSQSDNLHAVLLVFAAVASQILISFLL